VLSADPKGKRIALSMKALEKGAAPAQKQRAPEQSPVKKASLEDQLAALQSKFKVGK